MKNSISQLNWFFEADNFFRMNETLTNSGFSKEPGNPELFIYECSGNVHTVKEFVLRSYNLLKKNEQKLILKWIENLNDLVLAEVNKCITRSAEFCSANDPIALVKRSGARSAYWEERGLKFKGCRPVSNDTHFPIETLLPEEGYIKYNEIPFGILTEEAVLREILAYTFHLDNNIIPNAVPVCVYEYKHKDYSTIGYCLVLKTNCEIRIEEFIDYPEISIGKVKELIENDRIDELNCPYGKELGLKGINQWWYSEKKGKLLINFHFNGGFRGILNSNIGNDVIQIDGDKRSLFLCDFDTFHYNEIPEIADIKFLKTFVLKCLIEVMKGSLSIFEYIPSGENISKEEIAERLSTVYFKKSTLWKSYKRMFDSRVKQIGWDRHLIAEAFEFALKTQAFVDVVALNTLNDYYINNLSSSRKIYYSHN